MTRDRSSHRAPGMPCPYCGGTASIRTSRAVTATYREVRYWCRDEACGAIFVAGLTITHVMVPSGLPGVTVDLPLMARGQPLLPANDDRMSPPVPANDDVMSETG